MTLTYEQMLLYCLFQAQLSVVMLCFLYVVTKYSMSHQLSVHRRTEDGESQELLDKILSQDGSENTDFVNTEGIKTSFESERETNKEFKLVLERIRQNIVTDDKSDALIFRQFLQNKNGGAFDMSSHGSLNDDPGF